MTSRAIQMHLVGLLVPQLGQIFAKQAMGSSQLRQGARQAGRSDLAIVASSSVTPIRGWDIFRCNLTSIGTQLRNIQSHPQVRNTGIHKFVTFC
jgi:hypothetical protein